MGAHLYPVDVSNKSEVIGQELNKQNRSNDLVVRADQKVEGKVFVPTERFVVPAVNAVSM